jgi:hypothetical protein
MTKAEKFQRLHELVLDSLIGGLENGELRAMDLQTCITFLNNNKVVMDKSPEPTELETMDKIVEEALNAK